MSPARTIAVRLRSVAGLAPTAALLAALAGCKAVGPDFQPPAASIDTGYLMARDTLGSELRLSPDTAGAGGWWKAFGSTDLDRVMSQALTGNRTLAEADATLERAREQANVARAAQSPQADMSLGPTAERFNVAAFGFPNFPSPTLLLYSIGGTVSYDLDIFGGERRATEAAQARAETQARKADAAYLTLTGQAGMTALQIATYRGEIAAAEGAVADDQRLVDMTRKAEAAGGRPRSAVTSAAAQLAQDEAVLPGLRQQLAEARHAMALLVGQAPSDWTAPDFDLSDFQAPTTVPVTLPSTLVRRRPDILAAEADLHAATADIGVATASLYPDIKLSGNFIQTGLKAGSLFSYADSGWTAAAGLTQPLFHGGALKAGQRAAQAQARAALARYQQTVLAAFTQVADVMQAIADDDAELAALSDSETVSTQAFNDAQTAFRLGGGTLLPVIDAERQLQITRRSRVVVQGRRLADIAKLFVATAADWREPPP
jgi:NodT family efflux transporter outer membrane factor (OMF) lipoprotein